MKVLRVLVALFVVAMFAGVYAQAIDDIYMIPKTTEAPVIDGVLDLIWSSVDNVEQSAIMHDGDVSDGPLDINGFSRVMWDENNVYYFLTTIDDINWVTNSAAHENDSWEIYFDADNSKGTTYDGANDEQFRISANAIQGDELSGGGVYATGAAALEFVNKMADDGTGNYVLEVKVPMASAFLDPVAGTIFGFNVQQNDADGGSTAREACTNWWADPTNSSWNNASFFGTAMLWDREISTILDVHKTDVAPVIDGEKDNVWKTQPEVYAANYHDGDAVDNYLDLSAYAQQMWDDNYFYVFLTTIDDINWVTNSAAHENDSWEIYFDADNSKATTYDGTNDEQFRISANAIQGDELSGGGVYATGAAAIEFVNKMADDGTGNYVLEARIPMASAFLDPTVGTIFGYNVQQNDADGGSSAREACNNWWADPTNSSWNNASFFGTAELQGPITDGVTERAGQAKSFALSQNYPNPFNPTTSIDFSVTHRGAVKLAVYDLTGKQVANLVNEVKDAGNYTASFDASNLPSGVYFYKLDADSKVSTKKMMLLK